jgi:chromosome segregation ATPase
MMKPKQFHLLLIPCACFGVFYLGRVKVDPSIKSLKAQLADLQQQLQGFEELNEKLARSEIEIGWEKQHVLELEHRKKELSRKIVRTSDDIDDFKHDNAQMERWLLALRQQNERVKQKDDIRIQHLQEELSANRKEVNDAQKNNAALREVLHELRSLLMLGEKANAA